MKVVKDTQVHKNHKKMMTGLLAVGLSLVLAVALFLSLYPTGSGARYVDSEVYEGTEIYTTENADHGNHEGWVNLNSTYPSGDTEHGVSWSGTTCTISEGGKYYLSDDLTANIKVTSVATRDESGDVTDGEVIFCLDGFCLTCAADNTSAVTIGNAGSDYKKETDVVFSLYDCGGGKGVYYYKYRGYAECDGETYPTGYDFSDSTLTADTCDGYVRGGLITGASLSSTSSGDNYRGGGVTVGYGCTFKMYGGTIAGNVVTVSNDLSAGVYVDCGEFDMYGGMIAGNSHAASNHYGSGAGVGLDRAAASVDVTMTMYGGEIKENYKASSGGGICAYNQTGTSSSGVQVTMYGGSVSENYAQGFGGGVYFSSNGSGITNRFLMYGGTVRDNVAADGSGGGVYIQYPGSDAANLQVLGGAIYGNRAYRKDPEKYTPYGGGLYLATSGGVTLGRKAYIYGNYAGGKVSNLDLYSGSTGSSSSNRVYITLSSALEEGARVGVTQSSYAEGKITVTGSSTSTYQYIEASVNHILSDDRSYGVRMNGNGTSTSDCLELYSLTG